ncbi:hypothetical protein Mapa_002732 [Marchantia paleacea]|nr:hypothetical protein Mapa_002732 [Marchantia paleacea]
MVAIAMFVVQAACCCQSITGYKFHSTLRQPAAGRRARRLQVRIVCSAPGSTNGRPGGVDRAAETFNGSPISDDIFVKNPANYIQQEIRPRKKTVPASGREIPEGEDPFRLLENGQKVYLDELDVISLLEPPTYLRPYQSFNYNHAAFLWKKIGDIPEERRHRLLDLLLPRQITKLWEIANLRYDDPDLFVEDAGGLIYKPALQNPGKPIVWDGRVTNVPWYYTPFSRFQKVFFSKNGKVYGRVKTGGFLLHGLQGKVAPLYFEVQQVDQVMATDEFCDLVFDYGDGQLHLKGSLPSGFPRPVTHLPPFNDKACDYLRAVGPGVVVGQGWVEGLDLEQIPRRLFGEFVMIQKYQ